MEERKQYGYLELLEPYGRLRQYTKRMLILSQGEPVRSVMALRSGLVKVYGITAEGDQRTVMLLTPGDIFPMSWVARMSDTCIYYYEAATGCRMLEVERDAFENCVDENILLKDQIYRKYLSNYVAATMHVYALEHSYAQDKLVYMLQYLVARFGQKSKDGKAKIALRLSHQDIAEMVGVTRETAAVELHKLKSQGLIDYNRFTYLVDVAGLSCYPRGGEFNAMEFKS